MSTQAGQGPRFTAPASRSPSIIVAIETLSSTVVSAIRLRTHLRLRGIGAFFDGRDTPGYPFRRELVLGRPEEHRRCGHRHRGPGPGDLHEPRRPGPDGMDRG